MSIHYFAPMEGVTGYIYRRIHHKYYPGVDKYFAPFMSPTPDCIMNPKEQDFYKGQPRLETFLLVMEQAKMPVCYNGDICERAGERRIYQMFPGVSATMIGRGFLRNPDLLAELQGADLQSAGWGVQQEDTSCRDDYDWEKLKCFHDDIYFGYREATYGDAPALFHMKELWNHMQGMFEDIPDMPKILKKIRKATRHEDYMSLVDALWQKKRESEGF